MEGFIVTGMSQGQQEIPVMKLHNYIQLFIFFFTFVVTNRGHYFTVKSVRKFKKLAIG